VIDVRPRCVNGEQQSNGDGVGSSDDSGETGRNDGEGNGGDVEDNGGGKCRDNGVKVEMIKTSTSPHYTNAYSLEQLPPWSWHRVIVGVITVTGTRLS
jgi:hypothetical protein